MEREARTQVFELETGKKRNKILVLVALLVILLAVIFIVMGIKFNQYNPPEYDINAVQGMPEPEESYMYTPVKSEFGYTFYLAANMYQQENQSLNVFFANSKDNKVNVQIEILEENGNKLLYKSGVLRPGEYVESLNPQSEFGNVQMEVVINVHAFEPDTWYSMGSTQLGGIIQPW